MKNNSELTKFFKFQKAIFEAYNGIIEAAAKRTGITKQEADVLVFFFNNPDYTLAADAVKLRGFSKAYASKAIEQLEQNRMIEITEDADDRRMQRITLTGRGGIAAKSISMAQEKFFTEMLDGVTAEERFIMRNVLEKIYKNASDKALKIGWNNL